MSQQNSGGFKKFYESWFDDLHQLLDQLRSAPKQPTTPDQRQQQDNLVKRLTSHYTEYYRVKSAAVERDVLGVFAAPWASTIERSLQWIAGWRPTTVFHLIYTESSIQFESQIIDFLRGMRTGDLGDLSPNQFRRMSELQCETVKEENLITKELSEWQDGAYELIKSCTDFNEKIERLVSIVQKADDLRLKTIRRMVELLTPQQTVEFMIAAVELLFGIRGWGMDLDRRCGHLAVSSFC